MPSIRFDSGEIRKPQFTPEGFLRAEAVFARDGILEYRHPNGDVTRELRTPEQNQNALGKFGLKPVSLEHPQGLITPENARKYTVGATDSTVVYDDGYVRGVVLVYDAEAINRIKSGTASEVSVGYTCKVHQEPGIWQGQHYDAWQEIIDINHVCTTSKGRAGEDVRVLFDSVGQDFAYQDTKDVSNSILLEKPINKSMDKLQEKLDAYEDYIDKSNDLLADLGYRWDAEDGLFYTDNEDEEIEEDTSWEGDLAPRVSAPHKPEEDTSPEPSSGARDVRVVEKKQAPAKSSKPKPSFVNTAKKDSVADLLSAWREAETLVPNLKYDSALTVADIQAAVVKDLTPQINLDGRDSGYIAGRYDAIKDMHSKEKDSAESLPSKKCSKCEKESEVAEERENSRPRADYTNKLDHAINHADSRSRDKSLEDTSEYRRINNWKQPL